MHAAQSSINTSQSRWAKAACSISTELYRDALEQASSVKPALPIMRQHCMGLAFRACTFLVVLRELDVAQLWNR